jgi:hypothetical protein
MICLMIWLAILPDRLPDCSPAYFSKAYAKLAASATT